MSLALMLGNRVAMLFGSDGYHITWMGGVSVVYRHTYAYHTDVCAHACKYTYTHTHK